MEKPKAKKRDMEVKKCENKQQILRDTLQTCKMRKQLLRSYKID